MWNGFNYINDYDKFIIVEPSDKFYNNAINQSKMKKQDIVCIKDFFENSISKLKNYNFDFIILSSLLHEVENSKDILECIKKVCNEDTIIHINVPNALSFHRVLAKEMGLINSVYNKSDMQVKLQITNTFDLDSLEKILNESGFDIVEKGSYFFKPFTHNQMKAIVDNDIIDVGVLDGLYDVNKYFPLNGSEIFVNASIK